jgi:hypothetical protein
MGLYNRPYKVAVHGETRPVIQYHTIPYHTIIIKSINRVGFVEADACVYSEVEIGYLAITWINFGKGILVFLM